MIGMKDAKAWPRIGCYISDREMTHNHTDLSSSCVVSLASASRFSLNVFLLSLAGSEKSTGVWTIVTPIVFLIPGLILLVFCYFLRKR